MNKLLFTLVGLMFIACLAQAQEDGVQLAKSAGKALTSYNIDRANNPAKLDEAKQKIGQALNTPEAQALASAWITKGDIYSTILERDMALRIVNPTSPVSGDNDALEAFNAYQKGYELAEKKYEKSDALKGILGVQAGLINIGVAKYEAQAYEKAYLSSAAALKSHALLVAANEKSLLSDESIGDQKYFTGMAALMAGRNADAVHYFEEIVNKGTDKGEVYQSLYTAKIGLSDLEGANLVLAEGRKKFPDDAGLLFAEINYYLKEGKLDELTGLLKKAIQQEPDNISLYVSLGNVYENLQQRAIKAKNEDLAAEYFEEARKYYTQAIEKDAQSQEAHYMLGALYYNKAAAIDQEISTLPNTQAGQQRYTVLNDQTLALFDQALPHFQKAESLDPNDLNTLLALSEIYARKKNEQSLEFKKRLDILKGGGRNEAPYFKM